MLHVMSQFPANATLNKQMLYFMYIVQAVTTRIPQQNKANNKGLYSE